MQIGKQFYKKVLKVETLDEEEEKEDLVILLLLLLLP